jgi:hypothetical protein
MTMTQTYQRSPEAFDAPLDEVVMLLNVHTGTYHQLNTVAGRIWDLLEQPRSLADLVNALMADYEVEEEECRAALANFLDQLGERHLLASA